MKLALLGADGAMGRMIAGIVADDPEFKIVGAFTDPRARSIGEVVCSLISQGLTASISPETIVLAAHDLDVSLGIVDVLSLGTMSHDRALRAVNEGWF